jgi:hypothetical protein
MDKVIVTALLVIAGVTAAALVTTTLTPIVGNSSRSIVESQRDLSTRIQTEVEILTVHASDANNLKVWIKSIGSANITRLEISDVFMGSNDKVQFYLLPFTAEAVFDLAGTANNWITDKTGYWTSGETVEILIRLNNVDKLVDKKTYTISFTTSNGVQTNYQFQFNQ